MSNYLRGFQLIKSQSNQSLKVNKNSSTHYSPLKYTIFRNKIEVIIFGSNYLSKLLIKALCILKALLLPQILCSKILHAS
jgi:hypothetical protein